MNIDTVNFRMGGVTVKGECLRLPETYARIVNSDGEVVKEKSNRHVVEGKSTRHRLHVRSDSIRRELDVEGSLFAALYGQNVYTTINLRGLVFRAIKHIREQLKFDLAGEEQWLKGEIELWRIDIAENFRFESEEELRNILHQLGVQLLAKKTKMSSCGTSVRYEPAKGKNYAITFYDKGSEMKSKTRRLSDPDIDRLADTCEGVLRVELRLNHAELVRIGFNRLWAWKTETPSILFYKYLNRVPVLNVLPKKIKKSELDTFPKSVRTAVALIAAGVDLNDVYSAHHASRIRGKLKKLSIDSRCKSELDNPVQLKDLLVESKRAKRRKWMRKAQSFSISLT